MPSRDWAELSIGGVGLFSIGYLYLLIELADSHTS